MCGGPSSSKRLQFTGIASKYGVLLPPQAGRFILELDHGGAEPDMADRAEQRRAVGSYLCNATRVQMTEYEFASLRRIASEPKKQKRNESNDGRAQSYFAVCANQFIHVLSTNFRNYFRGENERESRGYMQCSAIIEMIHTERADILSAGK